jgi:hypothetical protein
MYLYRDLYELNVFALNAILKAADMSPVNNTLHVDLIVFGQKLSCMPKARNPLEDMALRYFDNLKKAFIRQS